MRTATKAAISRAQHQEDAGHQFAGMMIVSLFPAVFWTASIAGVGSLAGYAPSAAALTAVGAAVALVCASVFQMLVHRSR
jgi:hypothetical protein